MTKNNARCTLNLPENAYILLWVGRRSAFDKANQLPLHFLLYGLVWEFPEKELLFLINGRDRSGENYKEALKTTATGLGITRHLKIKYGLPLFYNNNFPYLDTRIFKRIIEGLMRMEEKEQSLTFRKIITVITGNSPYPEKREIVIRHVMWLLKYGFIDICR